MVKYIHFQKLKSWSIIFNFQLAGDEEKKDATKTDNNRKKEIKMADKHEKMLSPICYQENENESNIVTSFHSHQKGKNFKSLTVPRIVRV